MANGAILVKSFLSIAPGSLPGQDGAVDKLAISLLGTPRIARGSLDGSSPKGKKAWGLLAYLLLTPGRHTRAHLSALLFGNADDPLGALRWNLAQLRKALFLPESLRGPQLHLEVPPGAVFDVDVLSTGTWTEAVRLPGLGLDLLEGMDFSSDPGFEAWLMLERQRVRGITQGVLREAASACLGTGRPELAAGYATRAIGMDPFDEASHGLLVRAYAASGLPDKAMDAVKRCTRIFREELGCEPGVAVREALTEVRTRSHAVMGPASVKAQLDLGRSAIKAGAVDTGIESLRMAVGGAEESSDEIVLAESLLALAHALIHSVRGRDGEASALLHRSLEIAERNEMATVAAGCCLELGYVEMLAGSYERALTYLDSAEAGRNLDPVGGLWALTYEGLCYSDMGRYPEAVDRLHRCLSVGDGAGTGNPKAYALCLLGRIQMLRGELEEAQVTLERSVTLATECGWTVLLPWPQALLAEAELLSGASHEHVRSRLEHALSLAQQIGDPCWEGAALHGLGLVEAASGSMDVAAAHLQQASTICVRHPDSYLWMKAYILDALCDIASREGEPVPEGWVNDLQNLAARAGMNEFLARAYLYRARSGDVLATSTARLIAGQVDNPVLLSIL